MTDLNQKKRDPFFSPLFFSFLSSFLFYSSYTSLIYNTTTTPPIIYQTTWYKYTFYINIEVPKSSLFFFHPIKKFTYIPRANKQTNKQNNSAYQYTYIITIIIIIIIIIIIQQSAAIATRRNINTYHGAQRRTLLAWFLY